MNNYKWKKEEYYSDHQLKQYKFFEVILWSNSNIKERHQYKKFNLANRHFDCIGTNEGVTDKVLWAGHNEYIKYPAKFYKKVKK